MAKKYHTWQGMLFSWDVLRKTETEFKSDDSTLTEKIITNNC